MDVSIVRWSGGITSDMLNGDHASTSRTRRRRYFAVECTLRQHFRFMLDGNHNACQVNTRKRRLGVAGDLDTNQAAVTSLLQGISARGFADQAI